MKIQIKSWLNASILFECEADSLKLAVELAVSKRADLQGAYLRGAYLQGAYLQGADLQRADLRGEKLDRAPLMIQGMKWDF